MINTHRSPPATDDYPLCGQGADAWPDDARLAQGLASADSSLGWRQRMGEVHGAASRGRELSGAAAADAAGGERQRLSRLTSALHSDIIPRLVKAHASPELVDDATERALCADQVGHFTTAVLLRDEAVVQDILTLLREQGVTLTTLLAELLAPTARRLGRLWEEDRCHFADVTVGLGRLQQIMRSLSSAFGSEVDLPVSGRRVLLLPAPGEQHTFGLSMVAEFFARAGWEVVGLVDPTPAHVQDKVRHEWFDLVGISAGSTARLGVLGACIEAVRSASHNRAVVVMVGGPLLNIAADQGRALVQQVGADGSSNDASQAPALAETLILRRVKQA